MTWGFLMPKVRLTDKRIVSFMLQWLLRPYYGHLREANFVVPHSIQDTSESLSPTELNSRLYNVMTDQYNGCCYCFFYFYTYYGWTDAQLPLSVFWASVYKSNTITPKTSVRMQ